MIDESQVKNEVRESLSRTKKIDEVEFDEDEEAVYVYVSPVSSGGIGLLDKETDNLIDKNIIVKGVYLSRIKLKKALK
jgi:hypothetical protein